MKHKNLSYTQRRAEGRLRLKRLLRAAQFNPKDKFVGKELARVRSEIRQREASRKATLKGKAKS